MAPQASRSGGFSQVDLLVAIIVIGLVMGLALPGFVKAKDRALEAEVKSSLHFIQVALERYGADNGAYPAFLLGGTPMSWACFGNDLCLGDLQPDGLMQYGYMAAYPTNPFFRQRSSLCAWTAGDPRFGCVGEARGQWDLTMGNALTDPNFPTPDTAADPGTLGPEGFPYYFLGDGDPRTSDWIPGTFLYRSIGKLPLADPREMFCSGDYPHPSCSHGPLPERLVFTYYLDGYGSMRSPGYDYLHCYDRHDPAGGFGSPPGDVRCDPEGYGPWALLSHEPVLGTSDGGSDGVWAYIPNVAFHEVFDNDYGREIRPTNADGRADGLIFHW
ncbi:hypothetical protein IIA16_04810 [bacterium]|nr:hypothetical protein [bacterium]